MAWSITQGRTSAWTPSSRQAGAGLLRHRIRPEHFFGMLEELCGATWSASPCQDHHRYRIIGCGRDPGQGHRQGPGPDHGKGPGEDRPLHGFRA
ncbi:MAG: hypothetical protein MZU95_14205 [Desulfomicrobium escambiense]|nr:hypothetical protein [Desulfomicrobium escambiense]